MRALAEKVFGIGTVESRRRKPRVAEAAAQTTEVEPASEFNVEPEEAPPRHQSDHTGCGRPRSRARQGAGRQVSNDGR
jgi:hypothetical protein